MAKKAVQTARSVGGGIYPLAGTMLAGFLVALTSLLSV